MKKIMLFSLMLAALLYSCSKKKSDNTVNQDKFTCDIAPSSFPAGDTASIFIPNAFSPNGDGLNDALRPFCKNIQSITWSIYDLNNNQLYTTTDSLGHWLGPSNPGTGITLYHYKIKAVSNQGNTYSKCGTVCTFYCIPNGYNGVDTLVFGDQYDPFQPGFFSVSKEEESTFHPCN